MLKWDKGTNKNVREYGLSNCVLLNRTKKKIGNWVETISRKAKRLMNTQKKIREQYSTLLSRGARKPARACVLKVKEIVGYEE